jgi:hypothetical protein
MDDGSSSEVAFLDLPTAPVPPDRRHVSDTREGSSGDNRNGDGSFGDNENGDEEKMGSLDIRTTTAATFVSQEISTPPPPSRNCCVAMWRYGDSGNMPEARGYALIAMGMS